MLHHRSYLDPLRPRSPPSSCKRLRMRVQEREASPLYGFMELGNNISRMEKDICGRGRVVTRANDRLAQERLRNVEFPAVCAPRQMSPAAKTPHRLLRTEQPPARDRGDIQRPWE